MKERKINYNIIAIFEDGYKLEWEFDNIEEAKEQYKITKNYKCVTNVYCNEVVTETTTTKLF